MSDLDMLASTNRNFHIVGFVNPPFQDLERWWHSQSASSSWHESISTTHGHNVEDCHLVSLLVHRSGYAACLKLKDSLIIAKDRKSCGAKNGRTPYAKTDRVRIQQVSGYALTLHARCRTINPRRIAARRYDEYSSLNGRTPPVRWPQREGEESRTGGAGPVHCPLIGYHLDQYCCYMQ